MTNEQSPPFLQSRQDIFNNGFFAAGIKIDQDITQEDQIECRQIRWQASIEIDTTKGNIRL